MDTQRILTLATTAALATVVLVAPLPAQEKPPTVKPATAKPATAKPAIAKPKAAKSKADEKFHKVAILGMETRAPNKEERIKYSLKFEVRTQGQVVTGLARGGAAAKAGIRKGDIILKIEKVEIFSQDDIRDIVMVRKPGQKIVMDVIRGKSKKNTSLEVKLGEKKIRATKKSRLEWDYAGLGYLKDALARAKREQKRVLVGLSGAET